MSNLTRQQLEHIYEMVDSIPFSRPKRNIHRDFSDGCMMAELLHYFFPKMVELHNYPSTNGVSGKVANWQTLNTKVLKRIGIHLKRKDIEMLVNCHPNMIESILKMIFDKVSADKDGHNENQSQSYDNRRAKTQNNEEPREEVTFKDRQAQQEVNQEIEEWKEKIDQAYMQLLRLQDISRLKDNQIRNLQKKLDSLL